MKPEILLNEFAQLLFLSWISCTLPIKYRLPCLHLQIALLRYGILRSPTLDFYFKKIHNAYYFCAFKYIAHTLT